MKEVNKTTEQLVKLHQIEVDIKITRSRLNDINRYRDQYKQRNFVQPNFSYLDEHQSTGTTNLTYLINGLNSFLDKNWDAFVDHLNIEINQIHSKASKEAKKAMLKSLGMLDDEDDL